MNKTQHCGQNDLFYGIVGNLSSLLVWTRQGVKPCLVPPQCWVLFQGSITIILPRFTVPPGWKQYPRSVMCVQKCDIRYIYDWPLLLWHLFRKTFVITSLVNQFIARGSEIKPCVLPYTCTSVLITAIIEVSCLYCFIFVSLSKRHSWWPLVNQFIARAV